MEPKKDYNVKTPSPAWFETGTSVIHIVISVENAGQRLDQALAKLLPDWSRSRIQSWILNGRVKLDDQDCTTKQKVWGGERISISPDVPVVEHQHMAEPISLDKSKKVKSVIWTTLKNTLTIAKHRAAGPIKRSK